MAKGKGSGDSLSLSVKLLRSTLEAACEGIAILDPDGVILDTNSRFREMWGLKRVSLAGKRAWDVFSSVCKRLDSPSSFLEGVDRIRASGGTGMVSAELSGGCVYECHCRPLREGGAIVGRVWSIHDISGKVKAGKELRRLNDELERRIAERTADLEAVSDRSRRLEALVREIDDRERERFGREIHDIFGQTLTALAIRCEVLKNKLVLEGSSHSLDASAILDNIKLVMNQTRSISRQLFPVNIESRTIDESLLELSNSIRGSLGIDCSCKFKGLPLLDSLDSEAKINLYRIVQEATNNAIKHGKASKIAISLELGRKRSLLRIENNGAPLPAKVSSDGIGVSIMRSRAEMIGGGLSLSPRKGGGVSVSCEFSLAGQSGKVHKKT